MERAKLVVLVVIAVALVKLAFGGWVAEASADAGSVTCEVLYSGQINHLAISKQAEAVRTHTGKVEGWLEAHPGAPVFRSTVPGVAEPGSFYDIVCVRDPS
jgi:hypothetical protein